MEQPQIDLIDEIAGGYRASQVLFTASRLGLFSVLGTSELPLERISAFLSADLRGTRILCDALVALAVLEKREDRYRNGPLALHCLLSDSPQSKIAMLHHAARLYNRWGGLYDCVRTGKPVPEGALDPRLAGGRREFAQAMEAGGRLSARRSAELLDLSGVRLLLDLGGGPGIYSIEFARRNPELRAVILDDAETLEVARVNVEKAGLQDRVRLIAGNCFEDKWEGPYDFVFVSNVLHIYSAETNRELLVKCAEVLLPGGRLCLKDFILEPDRTRPVWAALFAVNMLVNTDEGDCYTLEEIRDWLRAAGLTYSEVLDLTAQTRMVLAEKPAADRG